MATEKLTILVVDDEPAITKLIAAILTPHGYKVLEVQEPLKALELCSQHPETIHLLVTDLLMPRMNGRQLAVHATVLRPQMRVLYISGYESGILMQGFGLEEEVAFLQKPFQSGALLQKVREVLAV